MPRRLSRSRSPPRRGKSPKRSPSPKRKASPKRAKSPKRHSRSIKRKASPKHHAKRGSRIRKNPNNPCSMRSMKTCAMDPNCHYRKRKGCARRSGVKKGLAYEGPMGKPEQRHKEPEIDHEDEDDDPVMTEEEYRRLYHGNK